jgi:serine phosphatase RsbU (regulator of sigma subunit)
VGGDYYDFLGRGAGRLCIVLADIAGKGISGALLMANLQANLRSQYGAAAGDDLAGLLKSVNRLFFENTTDDAYATMFFAEYEDGSRRLQYVNCGHLAALLLCANGEVKMLESTSTVLGLFQDWSCSVSEVQLNVGDILLLYTDGVTEANDAAGDDFGAVRLKEALRMLRHLPIDQLMDSLIVEVLKFSNGVQADDITLVVARCR